MYINLLTIIKNGQQAGHETVRVPFSNMDMAVAELLAKNNYVGEVSKKGRMPKRILEVKLRYNDKKGAIENIRFVSKPSHKVYKGYDSFRLVKQGYGMAVVSTSEGLMTMQDARKKKIGGQILFEIW